jgi:nucleoside recognition membrane protein YjiH
MCVCVCMCVSFFFFFFFFLIIFLKKKYEIKRMGIEISIGRVIKKHLGKVMYMGMFNCTPSPKFVPTNSLVYSNDVPIIYILETYPKFMASSK